MKLSQVYLSNQKDEAYKESIYKICKAYWGPNAMWIDYLKVLYTNEHMFACELWSSAVLAYLYQTRGVRQ